MYGPASSDLVNAKMADHRRYAKQVALENSARGSLRAERMPKRSWHSEFISFVVLFSRRLGQRGRTSAAQSVVTPRLAGGAS
jgi:hypothetical protein